MEPPTAKPEIVMHIVYLDELTQELEERANKVAALQKTIEERLGCTWNEDAFYLSGLWKALTTLARLTQNMINEKITKEQFIATVWTPLVREAQKHMPDQQAISTTIEAYKAASNKAYLVGFTSIDITAILNNCD